MDQERFVTIEEMEAATASLLENGKKVVSLQKIFL